MLERKAVTPEMMEAAIGVLKQWDVGRLSRKIENRDLIYEMLEAAVKAASKVAESVLVKSEAEWGEFFSTCQVIVEDDVIGQQIFRTGLESATGFRSLIGAISRNGAIVVPLREYPGLTLFGSKVGEAKGERSKRKSGTEE